jgi:hypothetical protein
VRQFTYRLKKRHVAVFILGCLGMGLLVSILWIFLQSAQTTKSIRETQVQNKTVLLEVRALSHRVLDCTDAHGACYQDGQRRTAKAVGSINSEAIVRSACSVVLSHQLARHNIDPIHLSRRISSCVSDTLATLNSTP